MQEQVKTLGCVRKTLQSPLPFFQLLRYTSSLTIRSKVPRSRWGYNAYRYETSKCFCSASSVTCRSYFVCRGFWKWESFIGPAPAFWLIANQLVLLLKIAIVTNCESHSNIKKYFKTTTNRNIKLKIFLQNQAFLQVQNLSC